MSRLLNKVLDVLDEKGYDTQDLTEDQKIFIMSIIDAYETVKEDSNIDLMLNG